MKIVLQTMTHGYQYRLAQKLLSDKLPNGYSAKIIEILPQSNHKTLFQKVLYYAKRQKLFSLCQNLFFRFLFSKAVSKFSEKSNRIDAFLKHAFPDVSHDLEVIRTDVIGAALSIRRWKPDFVLVIGSPVLPKEYFVTGVKYVNLHLGCIPDYRGLKCIEWAILNGEYEKIGYTIHKLELALDLGNIYKYAKVCSDSVTLTKIYADCYVEGISDAIDLVFTDDTKEIIVPKNRGKLYYSVDFNGLKIQSLLKKIAL